MKNTKKVLIGALAVLSCTMGVLPALAEDMPGWTPWMPGLNGNPTDGSPPAQWQPNPVFPGQQPFYYQGVALYDQSAQPAPQPAYTAPYWGDNFWRRFR